MKCWLGQSSEAKGEASLMVGSRVGSGYIRGHVFSHQPVAAGEVMIRAGPSSQQGESSASLGPLTCVKCALESLPGAGGAAS